MRYNTQLQNTMKLPLEFRPATLEFLNALLSGLGYLCIFNILSEQPAGQVPDDNMASLEREISNNFFVVKDVLKNNSELKKIFGYLLDDILAQYYEFGINCLIRIANDFSKKHAEAKTKGFIGFEVAYLNEANILLKNLDKESFTTKKAIYKKFEPIKKRLEETQVMNNEVFKAPLPKREELNHIKPIETKVRPLEPKNIRVPPPEAAGFNNFHSEEMENVKSSLNLFISNKRQHAEKTLFDLKDRLNQTNKTYNLAFLKNCAHLDAAVTPEAQRKIENIKAQGENGFASQMHKVAQHRQAVEQSITESDKVIANECEKDKQAIQLGSTYSTFVNAFADQIQNLNTAKNSFREYKSVEEKTTSQFEHYRPFLHRLCEPNLNLKELASNPQIDAFVEKHREDLNQIKKLADGLDMIINTHLRTEMEGMMAVLRDIDVEGQSNKILMNEKDIETIYKEINEKLGPMVISFEDKVTKVMGPMEKVRDIAQRLAHDMPTGATGNVNNVLMAIDFFFVDKK